MSKILETKLGRIRRAPDRNGLDRVLVEMPCGDWEPVNFEQYTGKLSVAHERICRATPNCGYHETHDFREAVREAGGWPPIPDPIRWPEYDPTDPKFAGQEESRAK